MLFQFSLGHSDQRRRLGLALVIIPCSFLAFVLATSSSAKAENPGADAASSAKQPSDSLVEQLTKPSQLDFGDVSTGSSSATNSTVKVKGSPEATVTALVNDLREAGNPQPIADYIDWNSAYERFTSKRIAERERIQISSPENLRIFYEDIFRNSPNILLRKIGPRLGTMPIKEQRRVIDFFKGIDEKSRQRAPVRDKALTDSVYEIQKTEKIDNRAKVHVIVTRDQKSHTEEIGLLEKNGLWYLDNVYLVKDPFNVEYR